MSAEMRHYTARPIGDIVYVCICLRMEALKSSSVFLKASHLILILLSCEQLGQYHHILSYCTLCCCHICIKSLTCQPLIRFVDLKWL